MNLQFRADIAEVYTSNSQQIRVLTEDWVANNLFCPICGAPVLSHYINNRPVADFFCDKCQSDFELKSKKSKNGKTGKKITGGAYHKMISRITSLNNPNFFFLTYYENCVNNFILIPNHFFTPDIIEKRKPLAETARRSGWIGCYINIENIPESGKIFLIKNREIIDRQKVIDKYNRSKQLSTHSLKDRSWLMDILNCVDKIPGNNFSLKQMYAFVNELGQKHPENHSIKEKIRQQLQCLRNKGFIEFTSKGNYRKTG